MILKLRKLWSFPDNLDLRVKQIVVMSKVVRLTSGKLNSMGPGDQGLRQDR